MVFAFLSPEIVEAIVAGQQPVEPGAQTLIKRVALRVTMNSPLD
jgi:hypothetical protein